MIVVMPPSRKLLPRLVQGREPLHVQAFVPQPPVEAFDESVFHRPPRTNEDQLNAVSHRPGFEGPTSEFAAIITSDALRCPAGFDDRTVQDFHDLGALNERLAAQSPPPPVYRTYLVKIRKERPSASLSLTKSMLQHWFGPVATGAEVRCRRAIFFRCFVRTLNPSSR